MQTLDSLVHNMIRAADFLEEANILLIELEAQVSEMNKVLDSQEPDFLKVQRLKQILNKRKTVKIMPLSKMKGKLPYDF